jgi:hypothetical protein
MASYLPFDTINNKGLAHDINIFFSTRKIDNAKHTLEAL